MQALVILLLISGSISEAIAATWTSLSLVKFLPEMLAGVMTVMVVLEGLRKGFSNVSAKYWAVFGMMCFVIVCGVLTNAEPPGPIISGLRFYLRAVPLFLVPAVFPLSEKQLKQQMKLVLYIALLQIPLTCYQRYLVLASGRFTGDEVRGTANDSGILSIFLICVVLVLMGYFLRKHIGKVKFFALFFAVLFPTTINETKATIILLPLGLLTTLVAGSPPGRKLKVLGLGIVLLGVFGAILVPIYDAMEEHNPWKNERHLMDFFTGENMSNYMENKKPAGLGAQGQVRRGDALRVPVEYLSKDPVRLSFGLGLGNASHSNLGEAYTGTYYDLFQKFAYLSFSVFLLELGLLGTALVFVLYACVFFDSIALAKVDTGIYGSIAIGYIGIVAVMSVSTFYTAIHMFQIISFMYWYFAGLVAARRTQLELVARTASPLRHATA